MLRNDDRNNKEHLSSYSFIYAVHRKHLDEVDVVKGTFSTGGQYQIIIGTGTIDKVYKELMSETEIEEGTKDDVKAAGNKKMNLLQRFVKVLSDIFIPIIPAIVAGGLLMGGERY